jgi:hypothetical protein
MFEGEDEVVGVWLIRREQGSAGDTKEEIVSEEEEVDFGGLRTVG